jgi:arylsulfatase A-like enzyme
MHHRDQSETRADLPATLLGPKRAARADGLLNGRGSGVRLLCVALVLLASTCTGQPPDDEGSAGEFSHEDVPDGPNVLVIVTDDQRAEGTLAVMPTVKRLFVKGGTRFDNAVATTPLCCPSRAGILTGRYSHNHGVTRNSKGGELDEASTLQSYLQAAGYRTATVGKYLQGIPVATTPPYFDDFATFVGTRYFGIRTNINGTVQRTKGYTTDFVGAFASRLIEKYEGEDDRPWFLYVTPNAPHGPYRPEKDYARTRVPRLHPNKALRERNLADKPPHVRNADDQARSGRKVWKQQLRMLMSVDDMVEKIFEEIDALEEENTIAIFMSDNGFMLGEHGFWAKRVPYRHSVGIPMLLRWPGHVEEGRRDGRLVGNIDVVPTILDATGIQPADEFPIDGGSLLSNKRRKTILLEEYENKRSNADWASILTKTYQFTEYYTFGGEALKYREYYDLEADPFELENLLSGRRSAKGIRVGSLSSTLNKIRSCVGEQCP